MDSLEFDRYNKQGVQIKYADYTFSSVDKEFFKGINPQ
jgi:hypothetical protein